VIPENEAIMKTFLVDVSTLALAGVGESTDPGADLVLTTGHVADAVRKIRAARVYDGMFRCFANATTPEGVAAFIKRYQGPAKASKAFMTFRQGDAELTAGLTSVPARGVDSRWLKEARAMHRCVELWTLVRDEKLAQLREQIRWHSDEGGLAVLYHEPPSGATGDTGDAKPHPVVIASAKVRPVLFKSFIPNDPVQPSLFYVQQVINQHVAASVEARVLWNAKLKAMTLHFVPRDLLGGLWLQFALAFTGNKRFEKCPNCGEWFEVSREAARESRQYCSDTCRTTTHQKRKEDAILRYLKGELPKEIAKSLDTTVARVMKWIGPVINLP
jgi:hypothetical protein